MATSALTQRQIRGNVLLELGVRFKSGDSPGRRSEDLEILDKRGVHTVDLVEAGERIKVSRDKSTYPPLAEILLRCTDARLDRLRADRELALPSGTEHEPSPDDQAQGLEIMALYRAGIVWCRACVGYTPRCRKHESRKGHGPSCPPGCNWRVNGREATHFETHTAFEALPLAARGTTT